MISETNNAGSKTPAACKVCGRMTRCVLGICNRGNGCRAAYGRAWRAQRSPEQLGRYRKWKAQYKREQEGAKNRDGWCRSDFLLKPGRRHPALIQFRKEHKITQTQAAIICGLSLCQWNSIERLRFTETYWTKIRTVADFIGVHPDIICPPEQRNAAMRRASSREAGGDVVMAEQAAERLFVPSPGDPENGGMATIEQIACLLKTLTYREREIIKLRYGIGVTDGHTHTLLEVGRIFKVTRERVRQVEAKAIRKLQFRIRVETNKEQEMK